MSMKFLFNRASLVVRTLEASGVVLSLAYFLNLPRFDARVGLFAFLFACYLFLKFCDLYPWAGLPRTLGIRVHFQKALVPTSYVLTLTALIALLDLPFVSTAVVGLSVVMMSIIVPVNGILIFFHRRDRDPLPVNYFSSNQYLEEASDAPKTRFDSSHVADESEKLQASGL